MTGKICTAILAVCLLMSMTACNKQSQEPADIPTVPEVTEAVAETAAETTAPALPQSL